MKMQILDYIFVRKIMGVKILKVKECVYSLILDILSYFFCFCLKCLGKDFYICLEFIILYS